MRKMRQGKGWGGGGGGIPPRIPVPPMGWAQERVPGPSAAHEEQGDRKGGKKRGQGVVAVVGETRQSQDQTHRSRDHSGETAGERGPTGAAKTGACIYVSI